MNKSKLAALILGGLALLWAVALFVGFPMLYARKVEALLGQDLETVRGQLGPPTQEWDAGFRCAPSLPCSPSKAQGGPVFLYSDGAQGWYLYFDKGERLVATEAVRPGGEDDGGPPLPLR